eukprot:792655-Rhodomonas_salina.2
MPIRDGFMLYISTENRIAQKGFAIPDGSHCLVQTLLLLQRCALRLPQRDRKREREREKQTDRQNDRRETESER